MVAAPRRSLPELGRDFTPPLLTLLMVVLGATPIGVPGLGFVAPMLGLAAVHWWTVMRPDRLPPVAAFSFGLVEDILAGMPIGMNAFVYVLIQSVVLGQRRFLLGRPFMVAWLGFALSAAIASSLLWLLAMAYEVTLINPLPWVMQWALSVLIFPLLALLFGKMQRRLLPVT